MTSVVRDTLDNPLATYRWLADGTKVAVVGADEQGFDYLGSLVYRRNANDELELESAAFGGGRINKASNDYEISYFLTDHLGSTRATVNQSGTVTSRNNYLPFGMQWQDPNALISDNRWLYNGKERQTTGMPDGTHHLDYGARIYDPRIARWGNIDPLAEISRKWTPYNYAYNNPLRYIDPDGKLAGDYYDSEGTLMGNDGIDDNKIYLLRGDLIRNPSNTTENWGGTLSESTIANLQENSDEVDGIIFTNRTSDGDDYTLSDFSSTGDVSGHFLEPGGPSTAQSNQDQRIPEGVYDVDSYSSTKFPDNFILSNDDVSQDRKILIHTGNMPEDTSGCLLPGTTTGPGGQVNSSTAKMEEIRTFMDGKTTVKMIIKNSIQ